MVPWAKQAASGRSGSWSVGGASASPPPQGQLCRAVTALSRVRLIKQGLVVTARSGAGGPAVPLRALTFFFLIIWLK